MPSSPDTLYNNLKVLVRVFFKFLGVWCFIFVATWWECRRKGKELRNSLFDTSAQLNFFWRATGEGSVVTSMRLFWWLTVNFRSCASIIHSQMYKFNMHIRRFVCSSNVNTKMMFVTQYGVLHFWSPSSYKNCIGVVSLIWYL